MHNLSPIAFSPAEWRISGDPTDLVSCSLLIPCIRPALHWPTDVPEISFSGQIETCQLLCLFPYVFIVRRVTRDGLMQKQSNIPTAYY
ncbi:unnamed protein product [Protopolystoma xenopodis]|uniref:Uncharacterized protein n=1 Tax=Protopolystoma xenopodis TaxID=117903 RepID=A0A448WY40_9PLAT|nr:unnamed protein product [Protopolystoma xenopodis]